ncbi:MAG: hypothetical protein GEEBNDBF_02463 [bacterium]|nr:hypothetical protein [bacterium]
MQPLERRRLSKEEGLDQSTIIIGRGGCGGSGSGSGAHLNLIVARDDGISLTRLRRAGYRPRWFATLASEQDPAGGVAQVTEARPSRLRLGERQCYTALVKTFTSGCADVSQR